MATATANVEGAAGARRTVTQRERRVVWLLDGLGLGGAERLALRFGQAEPVEEARWQVHLVGLRRLADPGAVWGPAWGSLEASVHQLDMRRLSDAAAWWRLLRLLRRLQPALLHTHLRYATVWGGAAARVLGVPHVTTVHVGPQPETGRQRWAAALERASRRRAARVIYVSEAQRAAWHTGGAHGERSVVIANGVAQPSAPEAPLEARRARGVPEAAWVVTTVAVVRAAKGWRTWLRAVEQIAARHPQAWFIWVGGGPELEELRRAAAASPCANRIQLPGARADVDAWLGLSDLFLFPSEQEAQPTAVIEAMAAGLAVVAAAVPATVEVLGGCGRLVASGDAAALAAAALELAAPGGRGRLAAAGRRRAAERFGEAAWRARLLRLYAEVAGG